MAGEQTNVIELSRQDWGRLVVNQINRLGIPVEEYFSKAASGEINCDNSPAAMDIKMALDLGGGDGETAKERFDIAREDLMELIETQQI